MLILARKRGESIQIGDGIVITVVEVRHSRVRLGIAAPRTVRIQRDEHLSEQKPAETVEVEIGAASTVC